MVDRFDLEQQILDCWHVTDDLGMLYEHMMESKQLDRDKIANIILGMKELYHLKFDRCFGTFEKLISAGDFSNRGEGPVGSAERLGPVGANGAHE